MTDHDRPPPLDPMLARLYAADRAEPEDAPERVRAALSQRLAPLLVPTGSGGGGGGGEGSTGGGGGAASGGAGSAGLLGALLRSAGLLALGGGIGAAVHAVAVSPRVDVRYIDRIALVDGGAAVPTSVAGAATADGRASSSFSPAAQTARPLASSAPSPDETLARERSVIETARAAVARQDGPSALAALDRHARSYPRGQLVEEREALFVQALAVANRVDDARAQAAKFRQRYPQSVFLPVVDAALTKIR